jgi:hypothetical protein
MIDYHSLSLLERQIHPASMLNVYIEEAQAATVT